MTGLRSLLELLLDPLDRLLAAVPLSAAPSVVLALLLLPVAATFLVPRRWILRGAPDRARWRDLRFWAPVIVAPYLVVYWLAQ